MNPSKIPHSCWLNHHFPMVSHGEARSGSPHAADLMQDGYRMAGKRIALRQTTGFLGCSKEIY
jgi:hypothetical protein